MISFHASAPPPPPLPAQGFVYAQQRAHQNSDLLRHVDNDGVTEAQVHGQRAVSHGGTVPDTDECQHLGEAH